MHGERIVICWDFSRRRGGGEVDLIKKSAFRKLRAL